MKSAALSFVQVMRELDLSEVRRQLGAPVRILVTGSDPSTAARLATDLFGPSGSTGWSIAVMPLDEAERGDERPDLTLLAVGAAENPLELLARVRRRPTQAETPVLAILLGGPLPDGRSADEEGPPAFALVSCPASDAAELARVVPPAAVELVPDLALALGRRFAAFRPVVAERLIREASRVNGQFALLSSLPANLPLVGGAASDIADLAFLTKNQGVLVYKLAGLYGRDLEQRVTLAVEIAPVVGGAFFWRTVARTLLGLLPGAVAGLPKAGVAYVGTYTVGQMARYYYSTGRRPSPELIRRFQAEGGRLAAELANRVREWRRRQ
jgi:uncharacterized protein (DUF697 family)